MAVIERLRKLVGLETHDRVVDVMADVLRGKHWTVDRDAHFGAARPDIVAHDPSGATYVIEVKAGTKRGYLGVVAQVEHYKSLMADALGREPTAILLLTDDAPMELDEIAQSAGVELIRASSGSPAAVRASLATLPVGTVAA